MGALRTLLGLALVGSALARDIRREHAPRRPKTPFPPRPPPTAAHPRPARPEGPDAHAEPFEWTLAPSNPSARRALAADAVAQVEADLAEW